MVSMSLARAGLEFTTLARPADGIVVQLVVLKSRFTTACYTYRGRLHLGGTRMSCHDFPGVAKLLKIHRGVAHHFLLGVGE